MKLIASAFHTSIQHTIRTSSPIQVIQGITHISHLIMDLHLIRVYAIHTSGTAAWLQRRFFRPLFCEVAFLVNEPDSEGCRWSTHLPQVFRHKRWKIEMLCKQRSDRKPCKFSHGMLLRDQKNRSVQRKSDLRKASAFVLKKVRARGPFTSSVLVGLAAQDQKTLWDARLGKDCQSKAWWEETWHLKKLHICLWIAGLM